MDSDHLGIWIHTRKILNEFDDGQFNPDSQILNGIANMFGGWKGFLLYMLENKDMFTWYQLYEMQTILLKSQEYDNIIHDESHPLSLLNIHNDCINKIYKYLPISDHINLSKTCSHLLTIGRTHTAFNSSTEAYKFGIIPKLPYYVMNFKKNNQLDEFVKCIDLSEENNLSPILYSGVFDDLIRISNIKNDINIKDEQHHEIERRKYMLFRVMESAIYYKNIPPWLVKKFNMKTIVSNYCLNFCANNPAEIDSHRMMKREDENNPYYKNAQIALYIANKLIKSDDPIHSETRKYVHPMLSIHHRRDSSSPMVYLGFDDPEVLLHYERLKVGDLEMELEYKWNELDRIQNERDLLHKDYSEKLEKSEAEMVNVVQSKEVLAAKCAVEINRYTQIINGLLEIPRLSDVVKALMDSLRK